MIALQVFKSDFQSLPTAQLLLKQTSASHHVSYYIIMSYSFLFKYIIIGDSGVGKSCLLLQFTDKRYRQKHEVTIGVEFGAKMLNINKNNIKLQIWDTAGQESFKSITRGYYRNAVGAVVCYDITSRQSFNHVQRWIEQATANGHKSLYFILVGNKADRQQERKVSYEEGARLAKSFKIDFIETSAKNGKNIEQAFTLLTQNIMKQVQSKAVDTVNHPGIRAGSQSYNSSEKPAQNQPIKLGEGGQKKKRSGCCGGGSKQ